MRRIGNFRTSTSTRISTNTSVTTARFARDPKAKVGGHQRDEQAQAIAERVVMMTDLKI